MWSRQTILCCAMGSLSIAFGVIRLLEEECTGARGQRQNRWMQLHGENYRVVGFEHLLAIIDGILRNVD